MNIDTLRKSIAASVAVAKDWFFEHATQKSRLNWDAKGQLQDNGVGAVYAFFDNSGSCLYVGQTTQTIKQRANVETSRHYSAAWWPDWHVIRFINTQHQTDQLILESLLILALSPSHNSKPAAREIGQMFLTQQGTSEDPGEGTASGEPRATTLGAIELKLG